ncbi:MAG: ice-binding family protein [Vicinamibacterales bacterium]
MKNFIGLIVCATVTLGGAVSAQGPPRAVQVKTVDLGLAARFAVLAGTQVTNTASATVINGDLGEWPIAVVPTGFTFSVTPGPGIVRGSRHIGTVTAEVAKAYLTIAYYDAAGRPPTAPTLVSAQNLAGLTFHPGVYKSNTSLNITGGDVTLNGRGVYIFQMGSALTVNTVARVLLTGGAVASDVFWQVGSSASLFSNSEFKGTILANTSITLNNGPGATMVGRALARSGNVTLNFSTITRP